MADDIVTRLRVIYCAADDLTPCGTCLPCQAADEIERLRTAGDAMAEALDWNLSCPCNDEPLHGLDAEMNTRSLTAQRAWQEARRG